ncbi:hypothetical protein Taro_047666 [Colocasia esculenta]|uniref:Uncharacterized protein n=1 Tax=Colocasia esculenta TaxID=4460 RepID=A0A843X7C2_COLES|nr:hypothetical protein [Colocasia esculenta]
MAESGRVAGSAPVDPDPESGQTRLESGRVGLSRDNELCKPVPWVGRCSPPESGRQGPTRLRVDRLCSESADSAIHGCGASGRAGRRRGEGDADEICSDAASDGDGRTGRLAGGRGGGGAGGRAPGRPAMARGRAAERLRAIGFGFGEGEIGKRIDRERKKAAAAVCGGGVRRRRPSSELRRRRGRGPPAGWGGG